VPVRVTVHDSGKEPDIRDTVFFSEYLEEMDKYSVFLGGIHGLTVLENLEYIDDIDYADHSDNPDKSDNSGNPDKSDNSGNPDKSDNSDYSYKPQNLLIIKDSYANSLAPLLITHYKKIIAVDLRYYRGEVSNLCQEYATDGRPPNVLILYSMYHIANDSDLLWLR
jgi:hypothetical protein